MRRPLIFSLGALAALALAHTVLWRWAEGRIESGFDDWAKAQRQRGWTVSAARPTRTGWPFHAALEIETLAIAGGATVIPGGMEWNAEHVALSVSLFHPRSLAIVPDGMQRLRVAALPEIQFTADTMTFQVPLEPGAPSRSADLRTTHLRVGVPHGPASDGLTLALMQAHFEMQPDAAQGEPALSFTGSSQDIGLPPPPSGATWPLGPRIASFSIEGALTGPVSRAADLRARAAAWRDGGGTLEIHRLATGWGPLGLSLTATLALDDQLQPMGAGTAQIVGQNEAINALASARFITANAATAAKAVLGLIARAPEGGGAAEADVPLTLQSRTLAVGRIPLLKLPPLVWPVAETP